MTVDVAQQERSNDKCYGLAFKYRYMCVCIYIYINENASMTDSTTIEPTSIPIGPLVSSLYSS